MARVVVVDSGRGDSWVSWLLWDTLADTQESSNGEDFVGPSENQQRASWQLLPLHIETLAYIVCSSFPKRRQTHTLPRGPCQHGT